MRKHLVCVIALVFVFSMAWTARAAAEQQTLAKKLIEILRTNHQITQQQYDELLKEAEKEKAARKARVAEQVQIATAKAAKEAKEQHPLGINASWKHHELYLETNNKNFTMHVGGGIEVDFGGADVNKPLNHALPGLEGYGDEVRRAKLIIQGSLYRNFAYMAQFVFGGGSTTINDLWLSYKGLPWFGNIKIGHQKEPFSLEELTSDNWFDFTERSLANAFVPAGPNADYNTGLQIYNTEFGKHMTWAIGGFMQQDDSSGNSFQNYNNVNLSARVTAVPWYADNGSKLLHLGFGFRHLFRSDNPDDATLQFANKPEWHLGVNSINTGLLAAKAANIIDPEAAVVYGPFSVQGEYFRSFLHDAHTTSSTPSPLTVGSSVGNPAFDGYYVFASYFLTGEHRNYSRNSGTFGRPRILHNFDPRAGTWGAWEVVARYSHIDLNDNQVYGGKESNWTGGLVWYLNPNVRWLFDYIHAHVDGEMTSAGDTIHNGDANIFDSRFQVAW